LHFDLGRWHGEFLFLYGKYIDLREFCTDKDAIYAHVTENRIVSGIENGKAFETKDIKKLEKCLEPKAEIIESAFQTFELQMPVIFSSYLEDALVTFLTVYFSENNHAIGEYVNPLDQNNLKGFVHLGDILKHDDIHDLKKTLASRAANNAASGKSKKKVFLRIENLTNYKIKEKVKQNIIALYEKRNEIVHENIKAELGASYIEKIYDDCIAIITEIGKICIQNKLPYSDPSGLMVDCT